MFPNVESISLQDNVIEQIGRFLPDVSTFPEVKSLNLSQNAIVTYHVVDEIPSYFPNLTSLYVTQNPFFTPDVRADSDPNASDKKYFLTLARIPNLQTLNYAKIVPRDREEGEIYYLSVANEALNGLLDPRVRNKQEIAAIAKAKFGRYQDLSRKYNHDSLIDAFLSSSELDTPVEALVTKSTYPAGSLASRLVTGWFYLASDAKDTQKLLKIPSSIPVTKVMSILLQQPVFRQSLRPLQFRLIYESEELDPVDPTTESSTRSATYGRNITPDQRRLLWEEWGKWDVDRVDNSTVEREDSENERWSEDSRTCTKAGIKYRRRETEIPHALKRPWGDWLDGAKTVTIRIEPLSKG